jgi:large subunit ribosomal protein L17e
VVGERVHFKPMFEVGRALKGRKVIDAVSYLEAVIAHKRAVPFTRYNEGVVHHSQGHEFGVPSAGSPEKSCKVFLTLLNGAVGGAMMDDEKKETLVIANMQVNRATQLRDRRTHQAHGSVKCYASPPTTVQVVITEPQPKTPVV